MYQVIGLKQTRGIKNVTLKAAKEFVVSRSTAKSNTKSRALSEGCHDRNTLRRVSRYEIFKNAVS